MIKLKAKQSLEKDKEIFDKIVFPKNVFSPIDLRDWTERIACADIYEEILPEEYLAPKTPILNQGSIGSCVAHSCATMLAQGDTMNFPDFLEYSRGFIYGNREDDQYQGEGMRVREALKQLNHYGDVLQEDFPYNEKYPQVKAKIEADKENLLAKASPYKIVNYYRLNNSNEVKRAILRNGGAVFAINVYEDFSRDLHKSKSIVPRGGHAMIAVGWTKDDKWIVQNSWGSLWGYSGKLYMDFDYPVQEWWGVNTCIERPQPNPDPEPEPKPDNWWNAIIEFFKNAILAIIGLFKK